MKSQFKFIFAAVLSLAIAPVAFSQSAPAPAAVDASASHGEIKKVDADSGKVTIKHGELKNIGMGAMTMVFKVEDKEVIAKLKVGDKIAFVAESAGGQLKANNLKVEN